MSANATHLGKQLSSTPEDRWNPLLTTLIPQQEKAYADANIAGHETALATAQATANDLDNYLASAAPECTHDGAQARAGLLVPLLLVITAASFLLALWTFEMFPNTALRWAAAAALIAASIASMELVLETKDSNNILMFSFAMTALVAVLVVHALLAEARVAMIVDSIRQSQTVAVQFESGAPTLPSDSDHYAQTLLHLLSLSIPIMALGMELLAGALFHHIGRTLFDPAAIAYRKRNALFFRMLRLKALLANQTADAVSAIPNASIARELSIRRRTWWSRERIFAMILPVILLLVVAGALFAGDSSAVTDSSPLRVAHIVDLTASRTAQELRDDIRAISTDLSKAEPGSRQLVVGIGSNGWADPKIILDAKVSPDSGWMNRNLAAARRTLVAAWAQSAAGLQPIYTSTDVIGTIAFAYKRLQISQSNPGQIRLYSDLRQSTSINLEKELHGNIDDLLRRGIKTGLVPDLSGAGVWAFSISTENRTRCYWETLRLFWMRWFNLAGAVVNTYTMARDPDISAPIPARDEASCAPTLPVIVPVVNRPPAISGIHVSRPLASSRVDVEEQVEGTTRDASARLVVVVRPVETHDYWCQGTVNVRSDGTWSTVATFGRNSTIDANKAFELMVISTPTACQREGEVLGSWPAGEQSLIVRVTRR